MKRVILAVLASSFLFSFTPRASAAIGTAFTYQGRLTDGGAAANGSYDLQFILYNAPVGGSQVGPLRTNSPTAVNNGFFVVNLDFGAVFNGAAYWLEIGVRTNGSAAAFSVVTPRQPLTPSPYAITASEVLSGGLAAGTYSNAVTFSNPANAFSGTFIGNGGGLSNVTAATLNGVSASGFWKITGNIGANPASNFLGTTDNNPLELRVNNRRAARLEALAEDATHSNIVNVIHGSPMNYISNGVYAGTIGGGGAARYGSLIASNSVTGDFGTIGGGGGNSVGGSYGTVAGGLFNTTLAQSATVGGGNHNVASNLSTTVAGGSRNVASAAGSSVGGGTYNVNSGVNSVIAGGSFNSTVFDSSTISGGTYNTNGGSTSTIGGGSLNFINDYYATIGGGGRNNGNGAYSTIAGGWGNTTGYGGAVGGGSGNSAIGTHGTVPGGEYNSASGLYAVVSGGDVNSSAAESATVAGGSNNRAEGKYASIGGGRANLVRSDSSTIGGGNSNLAASAMAVIAGGGGNISTNDQSTVGGGRYNIAGAVSSTVAGGYQNSALNTDATVSGGFANVASGYRSTVPGGTANTASGDYSFAAGLRAKATHTGAFVWGDSQNADVTSSTNNEFTIRASNGVRITDSAGAAKSISPGRYFRDNAVVGWGRVTAGGAVSESFGVSAVARNSAGNYTITLTASAVSSSALIPLANVETDAPITNAISARFLSVDQTGTSAFNVYIANGSFTPTDNDFVFMVTAR
jgi:hypothetical protein